MKTNTKPIMINLIAITVKIYVAFKNQYLLQVEEKNCQGFKPKIYLFVFTTLTILQCSVSCGSGTQERSVICRNTSGEPSSECIGAKPPDTQPCHSKSEIDRYEEITSTTGWEKLSEQKGFENITNDDIFDQYDNETWDEENYEDDAIEEDIETTRKTKVSTNPK